MQKKKQNRSHFTQGDRKRLCERFEAEEGGGPRAQQRVLSRMREVERRMEKARSGLQRVNLRKKLGI